MVATFRERIVRMNAFLPKASTLYLYMLPPSSSESAAGAVQSEGFPPNKPLAPSFGRAAFRKIHNSRLTRTGEWEGHERSNASLDSSHFYRNVEFLSRIPLDAFDVAHYGKFGNRCSCRRTCGGHCHHHHHPSLVTFRRWFPFAKEQIGAQAEFRHLQNLKSYPNKHSFFARSSHPHSQKLFFLPTKLKLSESGSPYSP